MIDYNKQFDEIITQIQSQYRNSNVGDLIRGIIEIKRRFIIGAVRSLIDDCINLSTARGDALDLWGNLLGLHRYVTREADTSKGENYNFWNFNKKKFHQLIFLQVRDHTYHALPDEDFQRMLLMALQKMYIYPTPDQTQGLVNDYFGYYGYVALVDKQDMSQEIEFSFSMLPIWCRWFMFVKDIIPRPACVKNKFVDLGNESFGLGFETYDRIYNRRYQGNLADNSPFKKEITE